VIFPVSASCVINLRVVGTVKQEEEGGKREPEAVLSFTAQHAASATVN